MENVEKLWKILENVEKLWKILENVCKIMKNVWKIMENVEKLRKMYGKLLLRYIVQNYVFISCSNYGYCTKILNIVENFMSLQASHLYLVVIMDIVQKSCIL